MGKSIVFLSIILGIACAMMAEGDTVMELKSPEFKNNGFIPKKFTCRGENVNPALNIENIPAGTKSISLIVDDPDAPNGDWVHWVMFDMPVLSKIEEDSAPGKQGVNDSGRNRYDGPCPPFGTHRYFFKAYALDTILKMKEGITKAELEKAVSSISRA
jgi:Raf kinase inhibitor-like YbhB/YbcL family protein